MFKVQKPYLIAEIGINHNGDITLVKKLIDLAVKYNFNAVKFQKRDISLVYSNEQLAVPRESPWGNTTKDQKEGLELGKEEYDEIDKYSKLKGIEWFASAWDINSLKFLDNYDLKFHKIASAMIIDINFLKEVAKRKKHTFISTGMSTKNDIDKAVKVFRDNNCSFELMHCVSIYPMKEEIANMSTIIDMRNTYNCDVGYSGHENGVVLSASAVLLGITSLERHITLDRTMYGSDQAASLEEVGINALMNSINTILTGYGTPKLGHIHSDELIIAKKLRSHIKI
jgi:N-acetylneuraminate synthase